MSLNQKFSKNNNNSPIPHAGRIAIQYQIGRKFYEIPLSNGIEITPSQKTQVIIDPTGKINTGDYILALLKMGDVLFGKLTRSDSWYVEIACMTEEELRGESDTRFVKLPFDKNEIQYIHKIRMIMFR